MISATLHTMDCIRRIAITIRARFVRYIGDTENKDKSSGLVRGKILLGFLAEKLISPNLSSFGRLLMLLCFYFLHCRFSVSNLKLFLTLSPLGFLAVSLSLSFNFFQRTSIYLPSCRETNEQSFQY